MSVCENSNSVVQQHQQQVPPQHLQAAQQQQPQLQATAANPTAKYTSIADYLAQLLKDRKQLAAFPNVFNHVERLLDEGKLWTFKHIAIIFNRKLEKNMYINGK
ncbi:protein held out wings-like [Lucilia sericata]|uniref:protein held out wings-like n=1 Tax=Lucilia sericata TaxID=13632 RepID=UPI0018A831DC|nr:protein held out wings-like [Lucilia sericata]